MNQRPDLDTMEWVILWSKESYLAQALLLWCDENQGQSRTFESSCANIIHLISAASQLHNRYLQSPGRLTGPIVSSFPHPQFTKDISLFWSQCVWIIRICHLKCSIDCVACVCLFVYCYSKTVYYYPKFINFKPLLIRKHHIPCFNYFM